MLTPGQRGELAEVGLLRLRCAVDPPVVATMRDQVWELLARRRGLGRDVAEPGLRVSPSLFKPLDRSGVFDPLCGPPVRAVLEELLGAEGWAEPTRLGQVLMTFPARGSWAVPHRSWHLDYPAPPGPDRLPGLQLFLFLDRVEPRGGGTLAVAGSHRLVERLRADAGPGYTGRSADVRKRLRRSVPWLRELWTPREGDDGIERFMRAARFDGVSLRVVEMTGEPGDVIAMHPWILHTSAPNVGPRPRMMLTARLRAADPPASARCGASD